MKKLTVIFGDNLGDGDNSELHFDNQERDGAARDERVLRYPTAGPLIDPGKFRTA